MQRVQVLAFLASSFSARSGSLMRFASARRGSSGSCQFCVIDAALPDDVLRKEHSGGAGVPRPCRELSPPTHRRVSLFFLCLQTSPALPICCWGSLGPLGLEGCWGALGPLGLHEDVRAMLDDMPKGQ